MILRTLENVYETRSLFLNVFVTANYMYPNFHETLFEVGFAFTLLGSAIINNEP